MDCSCNSSGPSPVSRIGEIPKDSGRILPANALDNFQNASHGFVGPMALRQITRNVPRGVGR